MRFLKQFFTWWNGQTLGTRYFTWRKGAYVGSDEYGNKYYRAPSALPASIAERRWVIYQGYSEASAVPSGWHGWIHHRTDQIPNQENSSAVSYPWQKPHRHNLTGTRQAYRPSGSLANPNGPQTVKPDYEAWLPK